MSHLSACFLELQRLRGVASGVTGRLGMSLGGAEAWGVGAA